MKNVVNAQKHGIDFGEAQALWADDRRAVIGSNDHTNETRQLVVGRIGDRVWTAIVTKRGEAVRIISVRRERDKKLEAYERQEWHRQNRRNVR